MTLQTEHATYPTEQYFINFACPVDDSMSLQEQYITLLQRAVVNAPAIALTEQIMATLNAWLTSEPIKIDKVWGALEAKDIKSLKSQLKSILGLLRQNMTIQVYWRVQ